MQVQARDDEPGREDKTEETPRLRRPKRRRGDRVELRPRPHPRPKPRASSEAESDEEVGTRPQEAAEAEEAAADVMLEADAEAEGDRTRRKRRPKPMPTRKSWRTWNMSTRKLRPRRRLRGGADAGAAHRSWARCGRGRAPAPAPTRRSSAGGGSRSRRRSCALRRSTCARRRGRPGSCAITSGGRRWRKRELSWLIPRGRLRKTGASCSSRRSQTRSTTTSSSERTCT